MGHSGTSVQDGIGNAEEKEEKDPLTVLIWKGPSDKPAGDKGGEEKKRKKILEEFGYGNTGKCGGSKNERTKKRPFYIVQKMILKLVGIFIEPFIGIQVGKWRKGKGQ